MTGGSCIKEDEGALGPACLRGTIWPATDVIPGDRLFPRRFALVRHVDYTGVSGIGVVAYGVAFADGQVVLRWCSTHPATSLWSSLDDLLAIHGHGEATSVEWIDQPSEGADAFPSSGAQQPRGRRARRAATDEPPPPPPPATIEPAAEPPAAQPRPQPRVQPPATIKPVAELAVEQPAQPVVPPAVEPVVEPQVEPSRDQGSAARPLMAASRNGVGRVSEQVLSDPSLADRPPLPRVGADETGPISTGPIPTGPIPPQRRAGRHRRPGNPLIGPEDPADTQPDRPA